LTYRRGDDGRSKSPADYTDFAPTGPDTLAGQYLRRFWQPVYLARDLLPGHAKPVRIMSEDFTLYRGEGGAPHLVAFRCAHRGTQLSTGWVEGDQLRCFYHGWKYDGSGQCTEMPAEDPSFPPKVRIASYRTEEYLGLIFAYLGDGNPPPLPRYPELETEGVREVVPYTRACNYFQNLENAIDEVHVAFVHRESGFSDFGLNFDIPVIEAEETPWGLAQYGTRANGVRRVSHLFMPNAFYFKASPAESGGEWRDQVSWRVPVDDEHHRNFRVGLTHLSGAAADEYRERQERRRAAPALQPSSEELAAAVLAGELRSQDVPRRPDSVTIQDHVAQQGQGVIADRDRERLGRSDVAVILLRKLWARELQALAEGRPLKEWTRTERLAVTSGL
jgi:5,5'-dehydrodivanillate O-demethylase